MKKGLTEIVFLLDRSGSMAGLESDTIGGFNAMIEKQKKADGTALVSTVLFDSASKVIHDRVNVQDVRPLTTDDYTVRGCTALLDAIGGTIHHIANIHKYARPEDVPEHTLFVITTDGMENASRRYGIAHVRQMIEKEKAKYTGAGRTTDPAHRHRQSPPRPVAGRAIRRPAQNDTVPAHCVPEALHSRIFFVIIQAI